MAAKLRISESSSAAGRAAADELHFGGTQRLAPARALLFRDDFCLWQAGDDPAVVTHEVWMGAALALGCHFVATDAAGMARNPHQPDADERDQIAVHRRAIPRCVVTSEKLIGQARDHLGVRKRSLGAI